MNEEQLTRKKVYAHLPTIVKTILLMSEGYLVGGALRDIHSGEVEPKDYDIIVPFDRWEFLVNSLKHTNKTFTLNTFGGFKYVLPLTVRGLDTHICVDVWPAEIGTFLQSHGRSEFLYSLKHNLLLTTLP